MPDEITLGELARRLDRMEVRMDGQFAQVGRQIENLQYVPRDIYALQVGEMSGRIDELEQAKMWLTRTIIASIAFPILVGIIMALVVTRG